MGMLHLFWLTWQQTMSRLLFWWHHSRRQANPQKNLSYSVSPLFLLLLSLSLFLSQTYWSRDQITDAKRRWARLKGGDGGTKKRGGKGNERKDICGGREIATVTIATPTTSPAEMENVYSFPYWVTLATRARTCRINFVEGEMPDMHVRAVERLQEFLHCTWKVNLCDSPKKCTSKKKIKTKPQNKKVCLHPCSWLCDAELKLAC